MTDINESMKRHNLRAVSYFSASNPNPRDLIALDGSCCILWRPADRTYNFDRWEPEFSGWFGGPCRALESAFIWLDRARDIRDGKASDFRGV